MFKVPIMTVPSSGPSPVKKPSIKYFHRGLSLFVFTSIALSLLSFLWLKNEENQLIESDFSRIAESRLASLEQAVEQKLLKLRSLAVLHETMGSIDRNAFPKIIEQLDFDLGRIRTVGWIPRVTIAERIAFERRAQQELNRHFHFRQSGPNGGLQIAGAKPEYYPVYYQYPETDDQTLGFDVSSAAFPMRTLNRARESGSLAIGIVPFEPAENQEISLFAVYPVFQDLSPEAGDHPENRALLGFYFVLAPVGAIYQNVRDQLPPAGLDLYIYASFHAGTDSLQILFAPSRVPVESAVSRQTQGALREGYHIEKRFNLGPGMPEIIYMLKPTEDFVKVRQTWRPWAVLWGGMSFSGGLVFFILLQIRHTRLAQRFAIEQQRYAASLEKEVEERKLVEERLKTSNLELEAFVYTVSHDLKTPLSAIIGHAEVLQIQEAHSLDNKTLESLRTIEEQGRRMNGLMEDLLTLARAGKVSPPNEKVDSSGVLQTVLEGLAASILEKNARIEIGSMPSVWLPRSLLAQIFENLVQNALNYGQPEAGPVEIDGKSDPSSTVFYVRDHGPGIPSEERHKIFEVFYRGTGGQLSRGTGIGLATVKKIVEQYNGKVWFEETPGGGATFFVKLPGQPDASRDNQQRP
jgi:signal transduction histidine kinase